jgi:hypothetical protein
MVFFCLRAANLAVRVTGAFLPARTAAMMASIWRDVSDAVPLRLNASSMARRTSRGELVPNAVIFDAYGFRTAFNFEKSYSFLRESPWLYGTDLNDLTWFYGFDLRQAIGNEL